MFCRAMFCLNTCISKLIHYKKKKKKADQRKGKQLKDQTSNEIYARVHLEREILFSTAWQDLYLGITFSCYYLLQLYRRKCS